MLILPILVLLGLSIFLTIFLIKSDRGAKEPKTALAEALGFGIIAIALALWLERLIGRGSLAVGFIEESAKFLPLALYIRKKKYFNEHNDGLIYFALAGVSFGLVENLFFLTRFGSAIGLWRACLLLFFHAATSGIVGYFFARHRVDKKPLWWTAAALLAVSLVHAIYNFGITSGKGNLVVVSLMATLLVNSCLFLFYRRAVELDQAAGLAAEGENKFCRHCGKPNPAHFLYCEHCGNQT